MRAEDDGGWWLGSNTESGCDCATAFDMAVQNSEQSAMVPSADKNKKQACS
jgi:hypothetical protein